MITAITPSNRPATGISHRTHIICCHMVGMHLLHNGPKLKLELKFWEPSQSLLCFLMMFYIELGPSFISWHVIPKADSRFVPSQLETSLQSNAVSHWLDTNLESALHCPTRTWELSWCQLIITGCNGGCHNDNIQCHLSWYSWQHDNSHVLVRCWFDKCKCV